MPTLPYKFEGLRVVDDAPVIPRRHLQAPETVLGTVRFGRTLHKDPAEAVKLEGERRARIIGEAFARDETLKDPALLYPLSLRVAYRLTRELARHLGVCAFDETLAEIDSGPWFSPTMRRKRPGQPSHLNDVVRDVLSKAEGLQQRGLCLLPPTTENGTRGHVELWHEAVGALVHHLNIPAGAADDPDYGGLGLYGLVEHGWPGREPLLMYESIFLDEITEEIVVHGQREAARHLRDRHGYRDCDIRGFFKTVKAQLREDAIGDVEEERALMALKLEELQRRAKNSLDLRVELGTLKQLGIVLGVTRAEPEDEMTQFVRTVKRVANESKKILPPPIDGDDV